MRTDIPQLCDTSPFQTTSSTTGQPINIKSDPPIHSRLTVPTIPTIPDSGERTEFPTGAVRDRQVGKGRCDLLPLDVVFELSYWTEMSRIEMFKKTGKIEHLYCALRFFANRIGDYKTEQANMADLILKIAKRFEDGAVKYGDNNWRKGMPCSWFINSGVRHFNKFMRGDTDEEHDSAFGWNIMACISTAKDHPELNEYAKAVPNEKV